MKSYLIRIYEYPQTRVPNFPQDDAIGALLMRDGEFTLKPNLSEEPVKVYEQILSDIDVPTLIRSLNSP